MSCILCYQSAHCHPTDYVGDPVVVTVLASLMTPTFIVSHPHAAPLL